MHVFRSVFVLQKMNIKSQINTQISKLSLKRNKSGSKVLHNKIKQRVSGAKPVLARSECCPCAAPGCIGASGTQKRR